MRIRILCICILASLGYSCGNSIPIESEVRLNRPLGMTIQAQPRLMFLLSYIVQNQENTFDGYDLYIARTPISEGEIYSSLLPFSYDGGTPTFRHTRDDFDIENPREVSLKFYSDAITRFEKDITYYFRMTAHSREGLISEPSDEVSAVARE